MLELKDGASIKPQQENSCLKVQFAGISRMHSQKCMALFDDQRGYICIAQGRDCA
jgi:hypothetical protein